MLLDVNYNLKIPLAEFSTTPGKPATKHIRYLLVEGFWGKIVKIVGKLVGVICSNFVGY